MDVGNLLELQGQFLLLLLTGLFLRKFGIFSASTKNFLTDLILYVTLPCSIILSFVSDSDPSTLSSLGIVALVSLGIQGFCFVLSKILYRQQDSRRRSVLRYGIMVSNSSFMGFPIAFEVFGSIGLNYASIYLIPQRIVVWTAGLSCFVHERETWSRTVRKIALHPGMVSVYVGLSMLVSQLRFPGFIDKAMFSLGSGTTPLSMMLIGAIIGEMDRSELKVDLFSLGFSAVRLVLIPLVSYLGCLLFSVDPVVTGVSVVLAGMPIGSTTAILAVKYGGDASFASRLVTITTVLSMITIPLWAMVV